jgi:hypothetical protein
MGSTMEALMQKRLKEKQDAYDAQWDNGNGSHHPDYNPTASGPNVLKARLVCVADLIPVSALQPYCLRALVCCANGALLSEGLTV